MHPEARDGFCWAMLESRLTLYTGMRVLDVGGQDVNGTVHDLFPEGSITTLDLENADILADARTWVPDRLFDVVIATEVFEHVREWPMIVATMRSALDPVGPEILLATCASVNRPPHGATGAPLPAKGEHYSNVEPGDLKLVLHDLFSTYDVAYVYPPGDAYMWARA